MRSLVAAVERIDPLIVSGRVAAVNGLLIEARGGLTRLAVGARAEIERRADKPLAAEVVGFRETRALLMPFGPVEGVAPGAEIRIEPQGSAVRPTAAWLGRIVDAFGISDPIDSITLVAPDHYEVRGGSCRMDVMIVDDPKEHEDGWAGPREFSTQPGEVVCE